MVTTTFIGRLGNNMFQIAVAIGYARRYGYKWAAPAEQKESRIHEFFSELPKTNETYRRYREHPSKMCDYHGRHYDLCHFHFHPLKDIGPDVNLFGFWQSWKYFDHCKDEVKEVFKLPIVEGYHDYISIHVRRGDYVRHAGSFPPIDMDYISKAVNKLPHNEKFIVFSDDINWCKENIIFDGHIIFSEGRNEFEDISLMASCGHHIIANSTFSWWAAYLGHNPDRVVVTPSAETWFGPTSGVKEPVFDLLLPEWTQIHTR